MINYKNYKVKLINLQIIFDLLINFLNGSVISIIVVCVYNIDFIEVFVNEGCGIKAAEFRGGRGYISYINGQVLLEIGRIIGNY